VILGWAGCKTRDHAKSVRSIAMVMATVYMVARTATAPAFALRRVVSPEAARWAGAAIWSAAMWKKLAEVVRFALTIAACVHLCAAMAIAALKN
jgi:hypothetical protein